MTGAPRISTKFNIDTAAGGFADVERLVGDSPERLGLSRVPVLILYGRIVATSPDRDERSRSPEEVVGSGD